MPNSDPKWVKVRSGDTFSEPHRERLTEESLTGSREEPVVRQVGTGGRFPCSEITSKSGLYTFVYSAVGPGVASDSFWRLV